MKYRIALLFLLFSLSLAAKVPLGVGLIAVDFNEKTTLSFFENKNDQQPIKKIEFFTDQKINSWSIKNLKSQRSWLGPEVLNLDYSALVFRCLNVEETWVRVIVNNETGKSLWLKRNATLKFHTWEAFLKNMFSVELVHPQAIRIKPNDQSEVIKSIGGNCFTVKSMKGDWIEIMPNASFDDKAIIQKNAKSGWVKWKNGNMLLINYFLTS